MSVHASTARQCGYAELLCVFGGWHGNAQEMADTQGGPTTLGGKSGLGIHPYQKFLQENAAAHREQAIQLFFYLQRTQVPS